MLTIRELARFIVAKDSHDTPGSESDIIAVDNMIKKLLDSSMAHILDRPGTIYTVLVRVDCREEFPEDQDLNRRF